MRINHPSRLGRRSLFSVFLLALLTGTSCHRPARSGALIDAYRTAGCVALTPVGGVEPQSRGWDAVITIAGGSNATVQGADRMSGNIVIRYEREGAIVTAVEDRFFVYPSDVRLNESHDRLLVKASGHALYLTDGDKQGNMRKETWLYEYDVQNRKEVRRQLVDPAVLPEECPMPQK